MGGLNYSENLMKHEKPPTFYGLPSLSAEIEREKEKRAEEAARLQVLVEKEL